MPPFLNTVLFTMAFSLILKCNQNKIESATPYSVRCERSKLSFHKPPAPALSAFVHFFLFFLLLLWLFNLSSVPSGSGGSAHLSQENNTEVAFPQPSCTQSAFALSILLFLGLLSSPEYRLVLHGSNHYSCKFP